jgi:hypothetical protein
VLPARLVLLASLYSAPATAQAPRTLAELAPNASGIALAEIVEVKSFDERPGDGNAGVRFNLRLVRGSGHFRDSISVVTDFGGLRPPGVEPPDPKTLGPLKADSLKKGERYWFAFASNPMLLTHESSQGIVAFWTEKQPKPVEQLEGAVKEDLFKWSPQFDPQTALSYGHLITKTL